MIKYLGFTRASCACARESLGISCRLFFLHWLNGIYGFSEDEFFNLHAEVYFSF